MQDDNERTYHFSEDVVALNPQLATALGEEGTKCLAKDFKPLKTHYRASQSQKLMTEKDFQEWFRHLALLYGYLFYHTHRAQFSPSGFPDNVLVRIEPTPRLIFAELKTDDLKVSQPSFEQWAWLYALQHIGQEAYLWRPSDRHFIEEHLK